MNAMTNTGAPAVRKLARIHNRATGTYLERYEFHISPTQQGQIELAPSVANDPTAFERRLRDAGAILPTSNLVGILAQAAQGQATEELVYEARTGWLNEFQGFLTTNAVIGSPKEKIVGVARAAPVDPRGSAGKAGTWKAWRDTVAEYARSSSSLMCAVSAAFAAPLLAVTGRQSFTLCLAAPSRTGKTIATLMAASVIGIAKVEDLLTWNTKDARLEQRLAEHNDTLFPIDDLQVLPGGEKAKYDRIRQLAYKIAQGWSTGRHDSFTLAHGGTHERWRCICITSNESSIRDLAQSVKTERLPGEAVRLIDLPFLLNGSGHAFDRVGIANVTEGWKAKRFAEIAAACAKNHGHAFERYVGWLLKDKPKLKGYVEARIDFFVRRVTDHFDGAMARDVAGKFAIIYAGGMLALRCGLVRWEKGELLDAIAKCYLAANRLLPDEGNLLRDGMSALVRKLLTLPNSSSLGQGSYEDEDGYRYPVFGPKRFIIKCDAFHAAFITVAQKDRVLEWLVGRGYITLAVPKSGNSAEPKAQFTWPDGRRRRSYELCLPHALLDQFGHDDDGAD